MDADCRAFIHDVSEEAMYLPRAAMAEILSCNFIFGFSAA
jgi:hypothetical protein